MGAFADVGLSEAATRGESMRGRARESGWGEGRGEGGGSNGSAPSAKQFIKVSVGFFRWGIAATWRRCDGGHGTRRTMVVGQRGHRSMVARGLSHRRAALRLVGWPRLRPRSQLPPAFEQLALGLTLPR